VFSVAVLFGAVSCADSPTAPAAPAENFVGLAQQYDSVAPAADKDAPLPSLSRAASLEPSLSLSGAGSLSKIQSVAFAPEAGPFASSVPGCDDCVFGGGDGFGYDIGFNFNFYGASYSKFWLSTNGFIAFSKPTAPSAGCCNGKPVPSLDGVNNMIALAWVDLFPAPGQISFETRGVAPQRRLIVNFDQVLLVNENNKRVTMQLVLFEGTNAIEIHTTSKAPLTRHLATQAAENAAADDAAFVQGRVASNLWAVSNDAVRFSGEVANSAPSANAGGNAGAEQNKFYQGVEGVAVDFKGSGVDADNDALSYSWDFDNDGNIDATTAEASFTYADNGPHSALLRVSDGRGGVAESRVDVIIANANPVVNEGLDVRIKAGETVSFSGSFSDKGANDALWSWTRDFGSLGSYSDKAENQADAILGSKRFCKAGIFPVKLTVVDKDGGSGSDERIVTVDAQPVDIAVSPNSINTANNGHGMITVRIFSRDGLDATALRPEAIKLTNGNGSGTALARKGNGFHWEVSADLNGDGRLDVTAGFRRDELVANGDLAPGANQLELSGELGNCGDVLGSALVYAKEKGR
jgi:PKD repeat protein